MTRSTPLVIAMLALGALAGGYLFLVRPIDCKRESMEHDISEKQIALENLQRCMVRNGHEVDKVGAVGLALANFQLKLPRASEMDKVLENIWHLAQANSLTTRTIKVPSIEKHGPYRQQDMDVTLTGSFTGFYQFLLQIEDSKRALRITKLHLSRVSGHEGQIQAEMTLGIFFEPDQQPAEKNHE